MSDVSGVPVPGRPPGHQHGPGTPAAAGQCSKQNIQGLPTPRAGSEYDDLHAHGADRYAPTDLRAFAARVDLITASEYEDDLRAYGAGRYVPIAPTEMKLCDMSGANFERPAPAQQPTPLQSAKLRLNSLMQSAKLQFHRVKCAQLGGLLCAQAEDMAQGVPGATLAVRHTAFDWALSMLAASPGKPLSPYEQSATLHEMANEVFAARDNMQQFLEEQELWLAEDHIAFEAASCIQAVHSLVAQERPYAQDKDNAQYLEQENELLCVQVVHSLAAQERPCAQEKDNAQYLEQKNGLRIQVGVFCERETNTVAAAGPETGVREMDMTVAAKIFAVAHQDHYVSKSIAADAPTGSTLNEPESRAFATDPRPHASRAKVKVGPLARIRINNEVYT